MAKVAGNADHFHRVDMELLKEIVLCAAPLMMELTRKDP
jgi:hypothetical protein